MPEVIDTAGASGASEHTAEIVQLIQPDDAVPLISGIPLIDIDSKVLARRLRAKTWEERVLVFNNAIANS